MLPLKRFVVIILSCMILIATMALAGVRFSEQPAAWVPIVVSVWFFLLLLGFGWVYRPLAMNIRSRYRRFAAHGSAVILSTAFFGFLGYMLFVNLWLGFGGRL